MNLIDDLKWRYAAKRMNGTKIPNEKIENILEAIRLSPSSGGLQPYQILVIENKELLAKIASIAFNQPQVTECSHLLVFCSWTDVTDERIENYVNLVAKTRNQTLENLEPLKQSLHGYVAPYPQQFRAVWTSRQAYIALGIAIVAAANEQVDATPMEGFNPQALDELLDLQEKGLQSLSLLALGYRDTTNDWLTNLEKVRKSKKELFVTI